MVRRVLMLSAPAGLWSCSQVGPLLSDKPPNTAVPEVPAQFRADRDLPTDNTVARVTIDSQDDVTPELVGRIRDRERDLVWTDRDNPERELEGMEQSIARSASRGPWRVSFTEAQRVAMRDGKPMVVWFTNSGGSSPLCQWLSAEVFSQKQFGDWAEDHVVRLRLDLNVKGVGEDGWAEDDDRLRKEDYLEKLKERFKVMGLPTVLVVAPDGTVTARYRGYDRSYGDFYFKRLKYDTEAAEKHHAKWKKDMERRGYRDWTGSQGRTVFAKLLRYHEGELILVEPDGKRLKTSESNLSTADRQWIEKEKRKRE